jgi:hypothetical protein
MIRSAVSASKFAGALVANAADEQSALLESGTCQVEEAAGEVQTAQQHNMIRSAVLLAILLLP